VLHRMTTWAQLTQVQISEERLFKSAFRTIEKKLMARRRR
jgi:hypothetical protein